MLGSECHILMLIVYCCTYGTKILFVGRILSLTAEPDHPVCHVLVRGLLLLDKTL